MTYFKDVAVGARFKPLLPNGTINQSVTYVKTEMTVIVNQGASNAHTVNVGKPRVAVRFPDDTKVHIVGQRSGVSNV